jgi:hypothetical protein
MNFKIDKMASLPPALSLESFPEDIQESLEPGKWYVEFGFWSSVTEIPTCPYCGSVGWDQRACNHLVLLYETESSNYFRVSQEIADSIDRIDESSITDFLNEHFDDLKTYKAACSQSSDLIWGYRKEIK